MKLQKKKIKQYCVQLNTVYQHDIRDGSNFFLIIEAIFSENNFLCDNYRNTYRPLY